MKIVNAQSMHYAEIPQDSKVLFSYGLYNEGEDEIVELFSPVKCRDFFNECCMKQWTGKDYVIYGFRTDNVPVFKEEDQVYLLCKNFPLDKVDKLKKTLGLSVDVVDNVPVVQLPLFITKYTYYISYITYLIRCVERFDNPFTLSKMSGNEGQYSKQIQTVWKKSPKQLYNLLLKAIKLPYLGDTVQGVSNEVSTSTLHNCSGIVGTFTNPNNTFRIFLEGLA